MRNLYLRHAVRDGMRKADFGEVRMRYMDEAGRGVVAGAGKAQRGVEDETLLRCEYLLEDGRVCGKEFPTAAGLRLHCRLSRRSGHAAATVATFCKGTVPLVRVYVREHEICEAACVQELSLWCMRSRSSCLASGT